MQVPKAVAPIRKALGDTTPESVQLAASQGTFATSNVEAVHNYSVGMEQQFEGKMEDALKSFTKASELDPNFARAYAGMAAAAGNLGQSQAAETYAKKAIALGGPHDRTRTLPRARPVLHPDRELAEVRGGIHAS